MLKKWLYLIFFVLLFLGVRQSFTLEKEVKGTDLIDSWKKFSDIGSDDVLRKNIGALDAYNKRLNNKIVPEPNTYLSQSFIDSHLAKFDDGAIRFTTNKRPTLGTDEVFVMPKREFDDLMVETAGDLTAIENNIDRASNLKALSKNEASKVVGISDGYPTHSGSHSIWDDLVTKTINTRQKEVMLELQITSIREIPDNVLNNTFKQIEEDLLNELSKITGKLN